MNQKDTRYIKWSEVREEKISNKEVRKKFCSMKDIACFISKRRLMLIGRVVQMKNDRVPIWLLAVFYYKKKTGRNN